MFRNIGPHHSSLGLDIYSARTKQHVQEQHHGASNAYQPTQGIPA